MVLGVIVCTLDKTYTVSDVAPGPKKETAGWFGFCQRFDSEDERDGFIDYIKSEGYLEAT